MNLRAPFAWACLLALAALACSQLGEAGGPAPTAAGPHAVVAEIVNQVAFSATEGGAEAPAASGQAVPAGSEVKTFGNARVRLDLPDGGGAVRLGQNSALAVRVLNSGTSQFYLSAGQGFFLMAGGGQTGVETPGGSATTDGQMGVEYYPDDGTGAPLFVVTCMAGACSVSNPFGGLALAPGQQTEAKGNAGLSEAHPIDPHRLSDWQTNVPEMAQAASATPEAAAPPASATPGAEAPASETPQPEAPSETPAPAGAAAPCVTATTDGSVRAGPGPAYQLYGVLKAGETAEVVGRDQTGTWFVILFPGAPGGRGWIWNNVVTPCGDHSGLPVMLPPVTPTFTASFTPTITPTVASPTPDKPGASITADSTQIKEGECTILRWTATNAREVYLNNQGIAGETSREVCPVQTTGYTLRVVGFDNSTAESSVTITVVEESEGG